MQVLITGATGRLGQILRAAWANQPALGFEPVWCSRKPVSNGDVCWDILTGPAPTITKDAVILHLAGVLQGDRAALSDNSAMALKVCIAAKAAGAAHVFLPSSAAVYGAGSQDHVEVQAPAPWSDYGRAKLNMERKALTWAQRSGDKTPGLTCLRIGNVLGADALFTAAKAGHGIVLDDVPGQAGGPIRSYIGPNAFAQVLAGLIACIAEGERVPNILNISARDPVHMADLLFAAQTPYRIGIPSTDVVPRVCLSTKRLAALLPMPKSDAATLVADWRAHMALAA